MPLLLRAAVATQEALSTMLNPRGVAIIGASADATKRGYQVIQALLNGGYTGAIYPVHPAGGELCGLRVWRSVEDIDGAPELALICTPASTVAALVEACGRKGIRGAVVLAVGFGELEENGSVPEAELRAAIERSGVRVIGPNTSGVMNLTVGLNLIGTPGIRTGRLALLVQSGNTALAAMTEAMSTSAEGLSAIIGVGNETDLRYHDYLEWLGADEASAVVLIYAEGFRDVRAFLDVAGRVVRRKPLVLLKGGRSDAGRSAARSHTGAVAGDYSLLRHALRQVGVIEVRRSDELLPVGVTLAVQPPLRAGTGVAILSDGGGHGTLAADALTDLGVPLASISARGRTRLRELLGRAAAVGNPIDLAGAADRAPARFADALDVLFAEDGVGGVIVAGLFGGYGIRFAEELTQEEVVAAERMVAAARRTSRTLVVHTLYARAASEPLLRLRAGGVPVVGSLEIACRCIAAAAERGAFLGRAPARATFEPRAAAPDLMEPALREGRDTLLETEVRALLGRYAVPVVEGAFCADAREVAARAAQATGPLAVKLVSSTITHKARAGGIALHVRGVDEAVHAYHTVQAAATEFALRNGLDADVRGMLLTPMLAPPLHQLIVGVQRHPDFGPLLTIGAGGSAVELLRDVAVHMLPITHDEVQPLLGSTLAGAALLQHAAAHDLDPSGLVQLVLRVADCFLANDALAELELNPVFVYDDRAVAIDARAFLANASYTA